MIFHEDFHKVQDMILPFFFALKALPYWRCHGLSAAPQVEPLFTGWQRSTAVSSSGIELRYRAQLMNGLCWISGFSFWSCHWGPNCPKQIHIQNDHECVIDRLFDFQLLKYDPYISILSLSQGVNGEIWCFFSPTSDLGRPWNKESYPSMGRETKTNQGDQKPPGWHEWIRTSWRLNTWYVWLIHLITQSCWLNVIYYIYIIISLYTDAFFFCVITPHQRNAFLRSSPHVCRRRRRRHHHHHHHWLVVSTPLKNMKFSWDDLLWKIIHSCSKPPTRSSSPALSGWCLTVLDAALALSFRHNYIQDHCSHTCTFQLSFPVIPSMFLEKWNQKTGFMFPLVNVTICDNGTFPNSKNEFSSLG